jgi:hypothetical protein
MPASATLEERLAAIAEQVEAENRKTGRKAIPHDCVQIEVLDGAMVPGLIAAYDLSRGGVGLISERPIEPDTAVLVELRRGEKRGDCLGGRVVHCRKIGGRWHSVGVRFEREVDIRPYTQGVK